VIADCFLFNDELDLLELRLMELGDIVDRFVVVESPYDFQMNPKVSHYLQNRERFRTWSDKIVRIQADVPAEPHPAIEHTQRRAIYSGIEDLEISDVVMMGDVDEIPARCVVEALKKNAPSQPMVIRQRLYYYRATNYVGMWNGTVVMARGLGKIDFQLTRDRRHYMPPFPGDATGWHFSWFGDAEDVERKLGCIDVKRDNAMYNSQLPDIPEPGDKKAIERRVALGDDLFGRDKECKTVPISPGRLQPDAIKEWLSGKEKYA